MSDSAKGFCYQSDGGDLDLRTLTATSVGAQVNALLMHAGVQVTTQWGDEKIDHHFERKLSDRGQIVPVTVRKTRE